jgi:hypothetical protein
LEKKMVSVGRRLSLLWLCAIPLLASCASLHAERGESEVASQTACLQWFESREATKATESGEFFSPDRLLGCFDGTIERDDVGGGTRALGEWAEDAAESRKNLVIRSHGGDAEVALAIAENLQAQDATVFAHELCASSCANYIFAGVVDRRITPNTLVLFHGGFSDQSRSRIEESLERHYAQSGDRISEIGVDRARLLASFDESRMRQDALLRRAGVDPAVIHAVDANDASALPAELCGGPSTLPRNFVYFSDDDAAQLGLNVSEGSILNDPPLVNRRIADFGRAFIACRLPLNEIAQ